MNMINFKCAKKYCCEDLSKIENYEVAINSDKVYDVHHRLEIQENGVYLSSIDLIKQDLYFKRPASELIFLSKSDHASLHANNNNGFLGKNHTEETKQKISKSEKKVWKNEEYKQKMVEHLKGENNPFYGKEHSEETKQKISKSLYGKKRGPMLEETKRKISAANKGKHNHKGEKNGFYGRKHSEETKQQISKTIKLNGKLKGENNPFYGKEHSEETKQKLRLAHLGKKKVWNDETHTKYHYE